MALNLPKQGSVDRSEMLEWVTETVFLSKPDGSTDEVTLPIVRGGFGPLPADPAWFPEPSLPGYLSRWLRATAPRPLRTAR